MAVVVIFSVMRMQMLSWHLPLKGSATSNLAHPQGHHEGSGWMRVSYPQQIWCVAREHVCLSPRGPTTFVITKVVGPQGATAVFPGHHISSLRSLSFFHLGASRSAEPRRSADCTT